jgi:hypothetical protein
MSSTIRVFVTTNLSSALWSGRAIDMPPFSLSYIGRFLIVSRIAAQTLGLAVPPTLLALATR